MLTSSYIITKFSIIVVCFPPCYPVSCPHQGAKLALLVHGGAAAVKMGSPSDGWSECQWQGGFSKKCSHFTIMVLSKAVKQRLVFFIFPILWGAHAQCLQ